MNTTCAPSVEEDFKLQPSNVQPVVVKRDGTYVPFSTERIIQAIYNAGLAVQMDDYAYAEEVAFQISSQFNGRHQACITEIQTAVENKLMEGSYKQLARKYIEYRHDRDQAREKKSRLNREIEGLVEQSDASLLNENANKDAKGRTHGSERKELL